MYSQKSLSDRLEEIICYEDQIKEAYPDYFLEAKAYMMDALTLNYPDLVSVYSGQKEEPGEHPNGLDTLEGLYGLQHAYAGYLKDIAENDAHPEEAQWYMMKYLDLQPYPEDVTVGYALAATKYPRENLRAYEVLGTYIHRYNHHYWQYYDSALKPRDMEDVKQCFYIMIAHFVLCQLLKKEQEGEINRKLTDQWIRTFLDLPTSLIPVDIPPKRQTDLRVIDGGKL